MAPAEKTTFCGGFRHQPKERRAPASERMSTGKSHDYSRHVLIAEEFERTAETFEKSSRVGLLSESRFPRTRPLACRQQAPTCVVLARSLLGGHAKGTRLGVSWLHGLPPLPPHDPIGTVAAHKREQHRCQHINRHAWRHDQYDGGLFAK